MELNEKLDKLKGLLKELKSVVVAYSGGVDSTFLIKVAYDVLGENAVAVTAKSSTYPEREFNEAVKYIKDIGAKHIVIVSEELEIEGFAKNPTNRCYYCKKELFSKIRAIADEHNINAVLDGSNLDDTGDYRPGMQAARELEVVSPLKECGLTKKDIRALSKEMGVPTWSKPSFACLSSRFPYGNEITEPKLKMVEKAEQFLLDNGFVQVRVRHHEEIARIEVAVSEREKFYNAAMMDKVAEEFKKIGYKYVTLDLQGYRTGSMNEVISIAKAKKVN
jgi:uncharacterized protein